MTEVPSPGVPGDAGRQEVLQALAILHSGIALFVPAGNRQARFTEGGRLAGLLRVTNGHFSFRTKLGTEFDVPLDQVSDVQVPGAGASRTLGRGHDLKCRVGGTQYWFSGLLLLWPDAPADQLVQQLTPQKRWNLKNLARAYLEAGLFAAHAADLISPIAELAVEEIVGRTLGERKEKPARSRPKRKPLRVAPADVFVAALTGKPVPAELTQPAKAAALDETGTTH